MFRIPHVVRSVICPTILAVIVSVGLPLPVAAQSAAEQSGAGAQSAPSVSDLTQAERQRVGRLFGEARTAFEAGEYVQAIDRLQRAHKLFPDPDIFYRIGQAYEGLDDHRAAIEAYRSYLDGRPDADDRNIVEDRIRSLERLLAANREVPGVLLVETEPAGARIWLDSRSGFPVASSPARIEVSDGEHFLYVAADGHDEVSRKVVVRAGQTSNVVIALKRTPDAPPVEGSVAPWVLMGTGGALVVAGGTTMFLALDAASTVDAIDADRRSAYASGDPIPERTGAYDDAVQRQRRMWVSTAVLAGAGVALITSGLVWWYIEEAESGSAAVGVGPTGANLRVTF